jgi:hypothetical protein
MKRAVTLSVLSLLLGAAVSQGVALSCYYRSHNYTLGDVPLPAESLRLPAFIRSAWPPVTAGSVSVATSPGRTSTTLHCIDPGTPRRFFTSAEPGPAEYGLYTESYGWPARSVMTCRPCVFIRSGNGDHMDIQAIFSTFNQRAGLSLGLDNPPAWLPKNAATRLPVPVWPLWGGLAVNTGAYGGLAAIVLFAPRAIRQAQRSKRGACLNCGYDLRGIGLCPECGGDGSR